MNSGLNTIAVDEVIQDAAGRLVREFDPSKIILFGSRATGHATNEGDIDLLVVMYNGTDRRRAAIQMHQRLLDLPIPKDVVVTTPEEIARRGRSIGSMLALALRDGKVLYERHCSRGRPLAPIYRRRLGRCQCHACR